MTCPLEAGKAWHDTTSLLFLALLIIRILLFVLLLESLI